MIGVLLPPARCLFLNNELIRPTIGDLKGNETESKPKKIQKIGVFIFFGLRPVDSKFFLNIIRRTAFRLSK